MSVEKDRNFMFLHRGFAETEYGRKLGGKVRWGRYKPAEVSNERWVQLLGADVHNLNHMPLTYGITRSFIRIMNADESTALAEEESALLEVG